MASVPEGGVPPQAVTYTYTVTNASPATTDPVTITSISDANDGSLMTQFKAANSGSATIAYGATVTFTVLETAPDQNAGTAYVNTLSVSGHDDENDPASTSATASISYTDVLPSLSSTAQASVASVPEGGVPPQAVTYTYTVTNTSPATTDPVTITSIGDTNDGSLMTQFKAANSGSATIPHGATVTFTVPETAPDQTAGTTYVNTLSVSGHDDENDPASTSATASISYTDVLPSLSSTAQASVASVPEGGVPPQAVTYTYTVTNTSPATTDPVTIASISDANDGSLMTQFKAANGGSATIPYGATVTFTVPETAPDQNAGTTYVNTLSVSGHDDENDPASTSATASISYTDVLPSLSSMAQASVASVPEGGVPPQAVTYTYTVTNASPATTDPVTITSISDANDGSLMTQFKAANSGSATIAYGATVTFAVLETAPDQNAGTAYVNTLSVSGHDDENDPASTSATASISYTDVLPSLSSTAQASVASVPEGGVPPQAVTYTYTVTNTSPATTDPVTITSIATPTTAA